MIRPLTYGTQLHEKVAAALREEIRRDRRLGERLPPDPAQAKRYGVSVVTIRDAMRLLVSEGLLERRRGSGTYVRHLNAELKGRIPIICAQDDHHGAGRTYWPALLNHLQRQLKEMQLRPEIHFEIDGEFDVRPILQNRDDIPLRGVIVVHASKHSIHIERLRSSGVPVVACDESGGNHWVKNDHAGLVREATRYLIEHGRRRLALITLYKTESVHPGIDDWMEESFMATLAQHDAAFVPEWVRGIACNGTPGTTYDAFRALWQARADSPDGLLITDDTTYPEVAMAILEMSIRIPEDLLVVTHANIGSGMFCPFPTVRFAFDPRRTAEMLVARLDELLRGVERRPPFTMLPFIVQVPGDEPKAKKKE